MLARVAKFAGKALAHWPSLRESLGTLSRLPPKGRRPKPAGIAHWWARQGSIWRCEVCLHRTRSRSKAALIADSCLGRMRDACRLADNANGHTIVAFESSLLFVLACTTCGRYGTARLDGLLEQCPGVRSTNGELHLRKLRRGVHPTRTKAMASLRIGDSVPFPF